MINEQTKHEIRAIYLGLVHKYLVLFITIVGAVIGYYLIDKKQLDVIDRDLENKQSKLVVDILQVDEISTQKAILEFLKEVYPAKEDSGMAKYVLGIERAISYKEREIMAVNISLQKAEESIEKLSKKASLNNDETRELEILRESKKQLETKKPKIETPVRVVEKLDASVNRATFILDVGHTPEKPGSRSHTGITEFSYNIELAELILEKLNKSGISAQIIKSGNVSERAIQINLVQPALVLSLHSNFFTNPAASGSEVLISSDANHDLEKISGNILDTIVSTLGLNNRGVKRTGNGRRGSALMGLSNSPVIILESFFLSNEGDLKTALENRSKLAERLSLTLAEWEGIEKKEDVNED